MEILGGKVHIIGLINSIGESVNRREMLIY